MTVTEMLSTLGLELGDPEEQQFTQSDKLNFLNSAQDEIISDLLASGVDKLWDLQKEEKFSVGASGYALSNFGNYQMLENGYVASRITEGNWIYRQAASDVGQMQNELLAGTDSNPICTLFANKYYLYVETYPQNITLWYIRKPKTMVASGATEQDYTTTTCELGVIFHPLVIKRAKIKALLAINEIQKAEIAIAEENDLRTSLHLSLVPGLKNNSETKQ